MADIFISYAREDVERVRVLADALAAEGWSVFWDRTIPFGMTWRQVIGKEIDEARCVVVAWSTTAIGSTWVHEEADDGGRRGILIPVLIEPVMPPIGFRSYQAADLSDWDGTTPTPVFERLIADITRLLELAPMEVEEARPGTETERQAEEAEAKRRADEEESQRRAEEEAKRKAEEEERKRAEERRKAEAEAVRKKAEEKAARTDTEAAAKPIAEAKAEREAERTPARPRSAAGKRIALAAVVVMAIAGIGTAVLWQSSTSEEERLARQEQMAAEEEAKRKAAEQEARRREEAEARRRAEEEEARRREEAEAQRRAEEEAARRAEDEAARTRAEAETDRDRVLEAQSLLADLGYDPGSPDGVVGPQTRRAIERHQAAAGLRVDGEVTPSLLASLREAHGATAAKRAEPAVERSPGQTFKDCDVCPEMVVVPAGSFTMGSPPSEKERDGDEGPQHKVTIAKPFAVGKTEVTFDQWDACIDAGGCGGYRPEDRGWGRGQRPVINVNWNHAQSYVKWLSGKTGKDYRLLTEAEWEYVARAGTETPFHFGRTISTDQANYDGNYTYDGGPKGAYRQKTISVGSFPANAFGLHDVHGNVWEWVADCYKGDAYKTHKNYPAMVGSSQDSCGRVLRGGSWYIDPRVLRSANRIRGGPGIRYGVDGFRVARTL